MNSPLPIRLQQLSSCPKSAPNAHAATVRRTIRQGPPTQRLAPGCLTTGSQIDLLVSSRLDGTNLGGQGERRGLKKLGGAIPNKGLLKPPSRRALCPRALCHPLALQVAREVVGVPLKIASLPIRQLGIPQQLFPFCNIDLCGLGVHPASSECETRGGGSQGERSRNTPSPDAIQLEAPLFKLKTSKGLFDPLSALRQCHTRQWLIWW